MHPEHYAPHAAHPADVPGRIFARWTMERPSPSPALAASAASESVFDYFRTTRAYLETHGKPVAFYSDKHNIFRVNNGEGGNRITQFGRALEALNIDIIS